MEIRIDGKAVATVSNIAPRPWGTYKLPIQVTGGQHLVAMALVNGNDWKTGIGEKRSLIIDTLTIANGTPPAAITAPPAKVLVSSTPSRANAAPLLDAAVTGNIYAFATADLAASKVQFWLDNATPAAPTGAPMTSDDTTPFDFAGADPTTGQALPFNVGALTNGLHTITAVTTMLDGSVQTPVTTSFMVNKVDIFVTDVPDRSNAKVLRGATVTGNIYVFTGPDTGVQMVEFWLDDATPSNPTGAPSKIEKLQPFDFGGTSNTLTALPFNATSLAVGPHTLTARVTMSDGTVNPPVVARFTRN
jgi:hypothetical protein